VGWGLAQDRLRKFRGEIRPPRPATKFSWRNPDSRLARRNRYRKTERRARRCLESSDDGLRETVDANRSRNFTIRYSRIANGRRGRAFDRPLRALRRARRVLCSIYLLLIGDAHREMGAIRENRRGGGGLPATDGGQIDWVSRDKRSDSRPFHAPSRKARRAPLEPDPPGRFTPKHAPAIQNPRTCWRRESLGSTRGVAIVRGAGR